jgi:hypothetical protein
VRPDLLDAGIGEALLVGRARRGQHVLEFAALRPCRACGPILPV